MGQLMTDASPSRSAESDFKVGRVLNRTSSVLARNFLTFFIVTAVAYLPTLMLTKSTTDAADSGAGLGPLLLGLFLAVVLSMLSQAVVLYGAFQDMRGRPVSLAESLQVGFSRFFAIVGLAIAMSVLVVLGFALLIIPGLYLLTMWFVATPACVVEQLGPSSSMRRSAELTRGHRWKIFGLTLVLIIISAVVTPVIETTLDEVAGGAVALIVGLIWNGVWGAFYAISVVVTYHDLRVAKEGVDIAQIAAVFD